MWYAIYKELHSKVIKILIGVSLDKDADKWKEGKIN
jgi:hypothetical protein